MQTVKKLSSQRSDKGSRIYRSKTNGFDSRKASHGQDIFNGVLSINYGKGAKMGVRPAIWVNLTLKNKRKAIRQSCMA